VKITHPGEAENRDQQRHPTSKPPQSQSWCREQTRPEAEARRLAREGRGRCRNCTTGSSLTLGLAGSSFGGPLQLHLVQAVAGFAAAVAPVLLEGYIGMSMKTLNPFNAPGSPQAARQRIRRERFKIVVWTIVAANVLLFAGLLIQGCQREPVTTGTGDGNPVETTSSDTNGAAMAQQTPGTNAPVTPTFEAPAKSAATAAAVTSATPNPVQAGPKQYVVVKGDSFYKIARANRVSMKSLAEANPGVDSAKLKIGQVLQVPAGAESAAASSGASPVRASATASQSTGRYVVKSGDTLDRIARAHGTTVRAIKAANGLTSDRIVAGRSLKMPATRASGTSGSQV